MSSLNVVRYGDEFGNLDSEAIKRIAAFVLGVDPEKGVTLENEHIMDIVSPLSDTWNPAKGVADILVSPPSGNKDLVMHLGDWLVRERYGIEPAGDTLYVLTHKEFLSDFMSQYTPVVDRSKETFESELASLINRYSLEQASGTPDFLLSQYLKNQLTLFNQTIRRRANWRNETTELPSLTESRRRDG